MSATLLILVLLAAVASLGSWLFNQWSRQQQRASALALGVGVMGLVLLLGVTAAAIVSTSASWPSWFAGFGAAGPQTREAAAPVSVADLGSSDDWPATTCIKPLHATGSEPRHWFLDNECERPIVVLLAWCDDAVSICTAGSPQAEWRYESHGLIMTSALARPTARRMPKHGAPIAGTSALAEPADGRLRLRYLACYLGEPAVAALAREAMSGEDFLRTLQADECYSRVASISPVAARSGQPPTVSFR